MDTAIKIIEALIGVAGIVVWMAFLALVLGGLMAGLAVRVSGLIASNKK
ncbi:MAG: hypothetical protein HC853_11875 [Anaerolineae bacterium]|nr:hypothetical protein [Anaerolineae bacterium]